MEIELVVRTSHQSHLMVITSFTRQNVCSFTKIVIYLFTLFMNYWLIHDIRASVELNKWLIFLQPRSPPDATTFVPARSTSAAVLAVPPLWVVRVPVDVPLFGCDVKQSTQTTPVGRLDRYPLRLPPEVLVVQCIVGVENAQIGGELASRTEVVDVDVWVRRKNGGVVVWTSAHDDR